MATLAGGSTGLFILSLLRDLVSGVFFVLFGGGRRAGLENAQ